MVRAISTGLVFYLLTTIVQVQACSCIDPGLAGHFANADNVFEAVAIGSRIVDTDDPQTPQMREIVLLGGRSYKGSVPKKVVIRTRIGGGACGVRLPFGGRYLVFTNSSGAAERGLYSSMCSGNRLYPFWRFSLRQNLRRLARGEGIPAKSKWAKVPSW